MKSRLWVRRRWSQVVKFSYCGCNRHSVEVATVALGTYELFLGRVSWSRFRLGVLEMKSRLWVRRRWGQVVKFSNCGCNRHSVEVATTALGAYELFLRRSSWSGFRLGVLEMKSRLWVRRR